MTQVNVTTAAGKKTLLLRCGQPDMCCVNLRTKANIIPLDGA